MIRDFSENTQTELKRLIKLTGTGGEKAAASQLTYTGAGSGSYAVGEWADKLGISIFIDNMNAYEGAAIEKSQYACSAAERVFDNVADTDIRYEGNFTELSTQVTQLDNYTQELSQTVAGPKGSYDSGMVKFRLARLSEELWETLSSFSGTVFRTGQSEKTAQIQYDPEYLESLLKKAAQDIPDIEKAAAISLISTLVRKHQEYTDLINGMTAGQAGQELSDETVFQEGYLYGTDSDDPDINIIDAVIQDGTASVLWQRSLLEAAFCDNVLGQITEAVMNSKSNSGSFAQALFSFSFSDRDLELLGVKAYGEMEKLAGMIPAGTVGLTGFLAHLTSENADIYEGKVDVAFNSGLTGKTAFGNIEMAQAFSAGVRADASFLQGTWQDSSENGEYIINAEAGNAYAQLDIAAGLYVCGEDGNIFAPGVNAKVGAGVSGLELSAQGKYENEYVGAFGQADIELLKADASGQISAAFFNNEGKISPEFFAGVSAQASLAQVNANAGISVLGADIGFTAGLSFGVGAHAQVGYKDGHFKADVGASLGIGASIGMDIDVEGLMKGVSSFAGSAFSAIGETIKKGLDWFSDFWGFLQNESSGNPSPAA